MKHTKVTRKLFMSCLWAFLAYWTGIWWGLIWAGLALVSITLARWQPYQSLQHGIIYRGYRYVKLVILTVFAALAVRVFLLGIYAIPSGSMESAIKPGDVVLMERWTFGPRRPASLAEVPNLGNLLALVPELHRWFSQHTLPPKRLAGIGSIDRGDIVVFDHPQSDIVMIKRVVGLPGDTLALVHGTVTISGVPSDPVGGTRIKWHIEDDTLSTNVGGRSRYYGGALRLTWQEALDMMDSLSVELRPEHKQVGKGMYPKSKNVQSTLDDWTPPTIPQKGLTVTLTEDNLEWYLPLIILQEGASFERSQHTGFYYINGAFTDMYTFKQDYFLVFGDNRYNSKDSRYWGFLPADHIHGVVPLVLFSTAKYQPYGTRRTFKKL
ncbi:signal peptidase I [Marinoscillum furvescens]|uniref:Signal peptidase I n=1 Tax=Marinoscillum furvescens DSM 4134 TaxID=1122208 RepID=A0A3D9L2F3_MARFU|nr:signal peptidase I [Marinoscillum furvescens]RED98409.1 signal peptidase I [Marinoscillum furvescens DSM 4134]